MKLNELPEAMYPNGFWFHWYVFEGKNPTYYINFYNSIVRDFSESVVQHWMNYGAVLFVDENTKRTYVAFPDPADFTAFVLQWG